MLSYEVVEHGQPLQAKMFATPQPRDGEVLMRLTRSGVCHSDLHIWDGYFDLGGGKKFYVKDRGCVPPFTLGHEPYGRVEAMGPAADGVQKGGSYIVYPWIGCGKCAVCKAGQDNYCLAHRFVGIVSPGAYSTHLLVPDAKYLVPAEGVDPSFAATLACSGLTVYSAIRKFPELGSADWIAVLGCGGLGLLGVSMLTGMGFGNVIACDIDADKLREARVLGASAVVNTRDADAGAQLQKISGGSLGAVIDFVGMPATANLGIAALRKGGRYVLVGLFGGELTLSMPPIAQRAIGVVGSYTGNLQELKEVVALAQSGKLKPTPVETRPASEANRSLAELKDGKVLGRIVLDMETASG
ncbi:MAG: alcohol dehydrogenase catalytic domain-containing protein [Betaproteobacteria bacterium]|nr:alcohol dehydrogenase catalytic domain-containing protein [Betaproteobacteria bacterium]